MPGGYDTERVACAPVVREIVGEVCSPLLFHLVADFPGCRGSIPEPVYTSFLNLFTAAFRFIFDAGRRYFITGTA